MMPKEIFDTLNLTINLNENNMYLVIYLIKLTDTQISLTKLKIICLNIVS